MDSKPFETLVVVERDPRHRDMVETCLKVLEGDRSAAEARRALTEAARESDVLVSEDGRH